jgi:hypothetical protein
MKTPRATGAFLLDTVGAFRTVCVLCAALPLFGAPHKLLSKNNETNNQNGGAGGPVS